MKALIHNLFFFGCILYLPAIACALARWTRWRNAVFLTAATLLLFSVLVRVRYNWPLVCLFQEPYLIALFIAGITVYLYGRDEKAALATGILSVTISYVAFLFPGDIYTAFPKTNSVFAHLFSISSSLARAAYLGSAALALYSLVSAGARQGEARRQLNRMITNLVVVGFASHSVGMFFGGFWSYVGWGAPLQWESRLFLGMAGAWFYYSLYLHLHLSGRVGTLVTLFAACLGGFLSFVFTFLPDTGVFHFQGIIR